jgi:hypothetical protein
VFFLFIFWDLLPLNEYLVTIDPKGFKAYFEYFHYSFYYNYDNTLILMMQKKVIFNPNLNRICYLLKIIFKAIENNNIVSCHNFDNSYLKKRLFIVFFLYKKRLIKRLHI